MTRVNVGGVNNLAAGPLYGFTILLLNQSLEQQFRMGVLVISVKMLSLGALHAYLVLVLNHESRILRH